MNSSLLNEDLANMVCLTVDVEWASPAILQDIVTLLDERNLQATFFCTQPDINVNGHERAIHPNFRRGGDILKNLHNEIGSELYNWTDREIYQHIIKNVKNFCPEAVGVRAHCLFFDSALLATYRHAGLEYDSSYFLPMARDLRPVWKESDILEIPIYYMDHVDLMSHETGFNIAGLRMEQPGMKVFDFHPNMIFLNVSTETQYLESKPYYHDYEQLLRLRNPGRGIRTLFLELLDYIKKEKLTTVVLADVNAAYRKDRTRRVERVSR